MTCMNGWWGFMLGSESTVETVGNRQWRWLGNWQWGWLGIDSGDGWESTVEMVTLPEPIKEGRPKCPSPSAFPSCWSSSESHGLRRQSTFLLSDDFTHNQQLQTAQRKGNSHPQSISCHFRGKIHTFFEVLYLCDTVGRWKANHPNEMATPYRNGYIIQKWLSKTC